MIWAGLLAFHLVGLVGYTLLLRKSVLGSINKYVLAAVSQTVIFLPSLTFLLLGKVSFHHTGGNWAALVGSGFMLAGLLPLTILTLMNLEASVWSIIFNLRLVLTTLLGLIFLHELPSGLQLLGGLIIFISILLLNLHKERRYAERSIVIGLLTTLWFSFHATLEKFNVVHNGLASYMVISGAIATCLVWGLVIYKGLSIQKLVSSWDGTALAYLGMRVLSAWMYVLALQYGSLAVTNYVSGMGVVLIVLFGVVLLKEKQHLRQKLLATATAVAGLSLILISKL